MGVHEVIKFAKENNNPSALEIIASADCDWRSLAHEQDPLDVVHNHLEDSDIIQSLEDDFLVQPWGLTKENHDLFWQPITMNRLHNSLCERERKTPGQRISKFDKKDKNNQDY